MKKINIYAAFSKLSKRASIQTLLSLGLLASFFLPWMKLEWRDDYTFGYDILLSPLKEGFGFYSLSVTILLVFSYLIIAVSVYNIIRDLLQINKTIFLYEFILGLIVSIVSVYLYGVSFGVYSLAIFSIWGIIKTRKSSFSFQHTGKVSIHTFFSAGLFISFCLPWISEERFFDAVIGRVYSDSYSSGFDIPLSARIDRLIDSHLIDFYLLYLIPVFAAYNIFKDFTKSKKLTLLNEFVIGAGAFFIINASIDSNHISLEPGFYATAIFSILGLFSSFFPLYKFPALRNRRTGLVQKGILYQEACNYSEAFICFYEAAKQNNMIAHNRLGELYEKGLGVEKNINMALKWYEKAAALGDEEAKKRAEILIKHGESEKPYE